VILLTLKKDIVQQNIGGKLKVSQFLYQKEPQMPWSVKLGR
jgi:hypothetical protein